MDKKTLNKLIIIGVVAIVGIIVFLLIWILIYSDLIKDINDKETFKQIFYTILSRRAVQVLAILIGVCLIGLSSLTFQTISETKILTPSVLGFDAIFIICQTTIVAIFGVNNILIANNYINFAVTTVVMIVITLTIYQLVLRKNKNNIMLLLLVGIVISALSRTFATFLQVIMNPDDFSSVTSLTNVSLTNINTNIVLICLPIAAVISILFFREIKYYDVMVLGEDNAKNLGINYNAKVKLTLIYIAIAVAIATALLGPLTFLGLIAVSASREIFKSNKHLILMISTMLLAVLIVIYGQITLELLGHITSLAVIINFIGGSYMIYLILRENKI